jgi:hypothetical protein
LIDDREKNGASHFKGELILFGSEKFKDWRCIGEYLLGTAQKVTEKGKLQHQGSL